MRRCIVMVFVAGLVVMAAPLASAGGSWLTVVSVDGAAPSGPLDRAPAGSTVAMRGSVCSEVRDPGGRDRWYARLRPDGRGAAVRLGGVAVDRSPEVGCSWRVSFAFVVPDVAPGAYWVDVCDERCTSRGGEVIGGFFVVADSGGEARLVLRTERLHEALARLRVRYRRAAQDAERAATATTRLREAREKLASTLQALDRAEDQRDVAIEGGDGDAAAAALARSDARGWQLATYAVLGLFAGIGLAAMVRRRNTVRIKIPDTPNELLEESRNPPEN